MDRFAHLLTPEVQQFIRLHQEDDANQLALRAHQYPGLPIAEIARQIQAHQKARTRLPSWYASERVLFPPPLSLEQSSSEQTARYKASLVKGNTLVDLTGGFGADAFAFANRFQRVIHVERNAELSALAAHNFQELGVTNITCLNEEAEEFLKQMPVKVDCLYLDPARRDKANGKVFRLEDGEPDVLKWLPVLLQKANQVLLKTSPMLDIDLAIQQLKQVRAVTVLAVDNECKEVLYQLSAGPPNEPVLNAVNIFKSKQEEGFSFTRMEEQSAEVTFSEPLAYLYEPNAALLKAGAFKSVANRYGLNKLQQHTHLYTSHALRPDFPGRIFQSLSVHKLDKKTLMDHLPEGKAHITVRNFPASVADIRRQTGIREGGNYYLFATTDLHNRKIVIITQKAAI